MPIPGTRVKHYAWPVLIAMQVLTLTWVFWPLLFLFRRQLADKPLAPAEIPRPNVRFLLAWTAMAAVILVALRLIAQHGRPLRIGIAHEPIQAVLVERMAMLPLNLVEVISIALVMIAFSSKPKHWLWSVPLAVLFACAAQELVIWTTIWMGFPSIYGVLAGPPNERLPRFAGTAFISVVVFLVASITGLKFRKAEIAPPTTLLAPKAK
jgi:hypothetical protein